MHSAKIAPDRRAHRARAILANVDEMAGDALRVLAVASKLFAGEYNLVVVVIEFRMYLVRRDGDVLTRLSYVPWEVAVGARGPRGGTVPDPNPDSFARVRIGKAVPDSGILTYIEPPPGLLRD